MVTCLIGKAQQGQPHLQKSLDWRSVKLSHDYTHLQCGGYSVPKWAFLLNKVKCDAEITLKTWCKVLSPEPLCMVDLEDGTSSL